ncbi:hypothetical protein CPB84DRAFT_1843332 [Gymnopilus junonius]|uniref:Uncharacterized protein n=1 Tax=Gymnopilus junonius TaxID=109634 RepID=A0A9P5NZC1_GYMJU|nr:hypothetical protein CPB84DRAFT_1843332 [Gymnopilus junonius]
MGHAPASSKQLQKRNSAFTSVKISRLTRAITFSDVPLTTTLHTPIYFSRSMSSIISSPTSGKRTAQTSPANSPVTMVDVSDSFEFVDDEVARSNSVSDSKLPSSLDNEESSFVPAEPVAIKPVENVDVILRSPSVVPADTLTEDFYDSPEIIDPLEATVEHVNSDMVISGEPLSYNVPFDDNFPVDENEALLSKLQLEDREAADTSISSNPVGHSSTENLTSNEKTFLPTKSWPKPPCSKDSPDVDTAVLVDENVSPVLERVQLEGRRLAKFLENIMVSNEAGKSSTPDSDSSPASVENMPVPVDTLSDAPTPLDKEIHVHGNSGQNLAADATSSNERHPPAMEISQPSLAGEQPSTIPDTNRELVVGHTMYIESPSPTFESDISPSEGPQDIHFILPKQSPNSAKDDMMMDFQSSVAEIEISTPEVQEDSVVFDTGDIAVWNNDSPVEEASIALEGETPLYREHQSPGLHQSLTDDDISIEPTPILTDSEPSLVRPDEQAITLYVSVEKDGSSSMDSSLRGQSDNDDAIPLTALDDPATSNSAILFASDVYLETVATKVNAPDPLSLPVSLELEPLPNADLEPFPPSLSLEPESQPDTNLHDLAHSPREVIYTTILASGAFFVDDDAPEELSPPVIEQDFLPLEGSESSIHVEPIQTDNNRASEPLCSTLEAETQSFEEPRGISYQPRQSPSPKLLDTVEPSTIPIPPSTTPIREVDTSPTICSISSSTESLSPATPVQQRSTEPLIRTEPPRPPTDNLLDFDISQISISWLMSNYKSESDELDDNDIDISGLELMYPEELC